MNSRMMNAEMGARNMDFPINGESNGMVLIDNDSDGSNYSSMDEFSRNDSRGDSDSYAEMSNAKRKFISDYLKGERFWELQRRNNEAAKRSREKRRFNNMKIKVEILTKENHLLKAKLEAIKDTYGISGDNCVAEVQLASLSSNEQKLGKRKRVELVSASPSQTTAAPSTSLLRPVSIRMIPAPQPPISEPNYSLQAPPPVPFYHYSTLPSYLRAQLDAANNSVLNLSCDRSRNQPYPPPYDNSCESGEGQQSLPLTLSPVAPGPSNSLLRHESLIEDKNAAWALVCLKDSTQEPGPLSSPHLDYSDISVGCELTGQPDPQHCSSNGETKREGDTADREKAEIARIASELAFLKNIFVENIPSAAALLTEHAQPHH